MTIYRKHQRMFGIFLIYFLLNDVSLAENQSHEPIARVARRATIEPEGRALFNPRIDYNNNQWVPVGHSDPLKNDPTFDYSPPTLDRVRYWHEANDDNNNSVAAPSTNYNVNEKSEILLLGVPTKHTIYPKSGSHHANQIAQDPKANNNNRRSSAYFLPEPSRVLTPPPMQLGPNAYTFDYTYVSQPTQWQDDLPADSFVDESASYLTVIKPKTSPNPYSATVYTKDVRDSIYHLAANVNSLESDDRRKAWVQALLQKEVTAQPMATTPQVVVAYSPHLFGSPSIRTKVEPTTAVYVSTKAPATTTTTIAPTVATTPRLPMLPVRPPMYLIIQGHSKVKTYGIDKSGGKGVKNEPKMVPVGGTTDSIVNLVTSDTKTTVYQVKHLHKLHTTQTPSRAKTTPAPKKGLLDASMDSLFGLLNSSLGFDLDDTSAKESIGSGKVNGSRFDELNGIQTTAFTITGPTTLRPLNASTTNGAARG